jgi:ElaB/YqjD/DUF883 family membrane-anchored ribosome-binding protein
MEPRKLFDPPLSLDEFLDHAQTIAIDPSEPSEVRAEAMRALSMHLSPASAVATSTEARDAVAEYELSEARRQWVQLILAAVAGLVVGVLVGLVLS